MAVQWYKEIAFYQIWPRSFADGNGDGIGDLYGVYEKLEYIRSLGIRGIWFSPLFVSPQADYGYDIADYRTINPEYGDMAIFRKVLDRAHALGMKVILDLVVNHTSIEHEWFRKSRDKNSPYYQYYFWRKGRPGGKPPNWSSAAMKRGAFSMFRPSHAIMCLTGPFPNFTPTQWMTGRS